jgi:hypothetical protein
VTVFGRPSSIAIGGRPVITIPFDYNEKDAGSVVPICIDEVDCDGALIDPRWFEFGVVPAADQLRRMAERILHDVWYVSEITEYAVHSVWRAHRTDLGKEPSHRILKRAHWYAEDVRVGGRRVRRKTDVELFASTVESLQDQFDLVADFENRQIVGRLIEELERQGMHDIRDMVSMVLRDAESSELVRRFGSSRNTLSQRFYRGVRKAARVAGITW